MKVKPNNSYYQRMKWLPTKTSISADRICLHSSRTYPRVQSRKMLGSHHLLIFTICFLTGHALECHPTTEYPINGQCCPKCLAGSHVRDDCTKISGTTCRPCETGTFNNISTGETKCFPCTMCEKGLRIKKACTRSSDAECQPLEGFFCVHSVKGSCQNAQEQTVCEPGQYIRQKGTAFADTVCSHCSNQTFSNGTSTTCQPHTNCESQHLSVIQPGTPTTDAKCGTHERYIGKITAASVFIVFSGILIIVSYTIKKTGRNRSQQDQSFPLRVKSSPEEVNNCLPPQRTPSPLDRDNRPHSVGMA
ncbi:tumor necrosis factor receptor superfamily member 5-like isoform X2 [Nerophis lumbriciformis]|uniref:tumor necrosis factor receptor superfamily member 5-like isoform X2 n=1 Tax=Nerophis lumbriciformis TaxID=546530 RepID=UPI002AE053F0|nr:tumor necrosis factor receptor superfamily member 14-like isoform X2 [Nerophis lumbriciformis]